MLHKVILLQLLLLFRSRLGLKLDTRKEPFDVIVIDRVNLPTEN
jgi:uncharacterized protein (TIGR03435 family)